MAKPGQGNISGRGEPRVRSDNISVGKRDTSPESVPAAASEASGLPFQTSRISEGPPPPRMLCAPERLPGLGDNSTSLGRCRIRLNRNHCSFNRCLKSGHMCHSSWIRHICIVAPRFCDKPSKSAETVPTRVRREKALPRAIPFPRNVVPLLRPFSILWSIVHMPSPQTQAIGRPMSDL